MKEHRRLIAVIAAILFVFAIMAWISGKLGFVRPASRLAGGLADAAEMSHHSGHSAGDMSDMPGMSHMSDMSESSAKTATTDHSAHGGAVSSSAARDEEMPMAMVSPEMQQLFGIRKVRPMMMDLTKDLTTFGVVEYDESGIKYITTRYSGWVTRIFADFTGAKVKEGDLLAMIYSPEIYTASEELILEAQARDRLKDSAYPDVASGAVSLYEKAWRRLELLGLSGDQIQAVVDSRKPIEDLPVYATLSGTVIKKVISEGSRVSAGDPLYQIADLSRVWLIASFYEADAQQIKVGQTATIAFDSRPGQNYSARVSFVYPNLDPVTRTLRARFELSVPEGTVRPGMFANVKLHLNLGRYLVVPEDAVLDTGVRQIVFVETGRGHFMGHPVVTGPTVDGWTAILSGLTPDDLVVADSGFFVDAESKIRASMGRMAGIGH
jgi:Cu(I)/Ag(I) efflux system membrane fusion protein